MCFACFAPQSSQHNLFRADSELGGRWRNCDSVYKGMARKVVSYFQKKTEKQKTLMLQAEFNSCARLPNLKRLSLT
jgi:hypothetical protein